jgi:hypothetical protein
VIQITDVEGVCHKYNISVSKFCCPVCSELLEVLNERDGEVQFVVRAHHSNLYATCLPPWLPDDVLEKMIQRFGEKLYEKFGQLPDTNGLTPFVPHHRNKERSVESAGESISSIGSTDPGGLNSNHSSWQRQRPLHRVAVKAE